MRSDPAFAETMLEPPAFVIVDQALGEWFRSAWQRRLARAAGDHAKVAAAMRKQGIPVDVARALLFVREDQPGAGS